MDFTRFKDIHQFYEETGMSRQETFMFLLKELEEVNK